MRVAAAINLNKEMRAELHRLVRRRTTPVRVAERIQRGPDLACPWFEAAPGGELQGQQ